MSNGARGVFDAVQGLFDKGSKRAPMLEGLETLLYESIRAGISEMASVKPPYNPYLYESLLVDVGKLLDRCISNRRECCDLEAQWVRRALEYQLFDNLFPSQESLKNLITSTTALGQQKDACQFAADAFGNDTVERGLKVLYANQATSLASQTLNEGDKNKALSNILNEQKRYQELLEIRHTTPGHSLNFRQRRDQLVTLIVTDIQEAYQKARAAAAGLGLQLGIVAERPFPEIHDDASDAEFLDNFVLWVRSIATRYEIYSNDEAIFEVIIPVVAPFAFDNKVPISLKSSTDFDLAMQGNGILAGIDLKNALPSDACLKNLRVVGLALSIGYKGDNFDSIHTTAFLRNWSALVFPPRQEDPLNRGETLESRKPARFAYITAQLKDAKVDLCIGDEIRNVDPRAGSWTVVLDELMNYPHSQPLGKWPRDTDNLKDIKFHLKLLGKPSNNATDWGTKVPEFANASGKGA